ncbi:esterase/lipase family protein [Tepidiforma sp.]|uniref:esterase/lipase family protein n=1 Tax=Tepidiforma sp. TaxID=2682230 RepID=UPI002ADDF600|nr:alpha/beta fold hydrolase [Tepidiforma sp.]
MNVAAQAWVGDPFAEDPSLQPAPTPIWREALVGLEWLALRASPVYWGFGVPRGRGEPVVVVPGFLASDLSLVELYWWLGRIGYRPYFSNIGRNADCPDYVARKLLETVRRARQETGQRVRLVGHSLGGMLSRSVALDHPDEVAMVITLGSPFRDAVRAHPALISAAALLRERSGSLVAPNVGPACFSGHCTCGFVRNMLAPGRWEVARVAVYSRRDGVVDWQSCVEEDPALNVEVHCSHLGMVVHPQVYRVVAERLREASAE